VEGQSPGGVGRSPPRKRHKDYHLVLHPRVQAPGRKDGTHPSLLRGTPRPETKQQVKTQTLQTRNECKPSASSDTAVELGEADPPCASSFSSSRAAISPVASGLLFLCPRQVAPSRAPSLDSATTTAPQPEPW
jgi:hypothetical protein